MRISVIHNNPRRIDHRMTNTVLGLFHLLQFDAEWAANLKDDVTFHYHGCADNAYGAYRHDKDGHHIYLRPRKRHPQGLAFTLAHELRHAWQYENGLLSTMDGQPWKWYGEGYENGLWCTGDYDTDPSERDADAVARAWVQEAWSA